MTRHCDDYIDDPDAPQCLRDFLSHARAPAHGAYIDAPTPKLFATLNGKRVRVTVASRFGDVGVAFDLTAEHGYSMRVNVAALTDFSTEETQATPDRSA